ncbi:hypothetical protein SERLADRAFT_414047 [Serpula lacrymans var. lacrymans S7.9]|uniref:DDE Tnp4 domain-containing protein n=1 Tax=Serpula lacrymans var. lacrymans (strain S7.9) TaxID=578457 RepID=F8NPY8_SERL9|nr:uncharacterized protein SERLADRAFT_414047 [Serpula lacrymans var. lacrymans S7.9]EGO27776.1 hypothetical protein SERLADRAFT_414047 [Serpula lacrymans var. lacrymans S7.9]
MLVYPIMPTALTRNRPTIRQQRRQQLDRTVKKVLHQLIHRPRTVSNDDDEDDPSIHSSASPSDHSISSASSDSTDDHISMSVSSISSRIPSELRIGRAKISHIRLVITKYRHLLHPPAPRHYGNRASVADIADWSGVSVGGVELCTKRCMIAIISLHDDVIKAPTPAEKEAAKCWVERQVVTLPHNLKIVDYCVGHTGSIHDASAYLDTGLRTQPESFLGPGEWIWADSAYPLSATCVPPFKQPPNGALTRRQRHFNYYLSRVRIRSEHAIGLLKIRFQSLKELRIQK